MSSFAKINTKALKFSGTSSPAESKAQRQTAAESKAEQQFTETKSEQKPITESESKAGQTAPAMRAPTARDVSGFDLASLTSAQLMHVAAYADVYGKTRGRFIVRGKYEVLHHSASRLALDPKVVTYELATVGPMAREILAVRKQQGVQLPAYVFGRDPTPEGWTGRFAVTCDDTQKELSEAIRYWQQDDTLDFQRKHNAKVAQAKHVTVTGADKAEAEAEAELDEILKSPEKALDEYLQAKGKPQ